MRGASHPRLLMRSGGCLISGNAHDRDENETMSAAISVPARRRLMSAALSVFLLVSVVACSSGNDAGRRDTRTDTDCTKQNRLSADGDSSSSSSAQAGSPSQSGSGASGDSSAAASGDPGSNTGAGSGTSGQGAGSGDCGGASGYSTSDDGGTGSGG